MHERSTSAALKGALRRGQRMAVASADWSSWASSLGLAVGLGAVWLATYAAGGTHTVMPHLFYAPVVIAATRFNHFGALVAALGAGVLAGPLMPLNVAAGTHQQPLGWLLRMAFFVLIGQTVAVFSNRSLSELSTVVADVRRGAELEAALERQEFRLVYQPLYDLGSGAVVGVEALVRWQHPERGTVTPDGFIEAAERTGAILPLGRWVLREAVQQLAGWHATTPAGRHLKVAVNLSARQLEDDGLTDHVVAVLRDSQLPPSALQLEVTETALITDLDMASTRLRQLQALGVGIAIDDFGTGQSSLSYLHRFHADVVKIDRSFVREVQHDAHARAVAEGVVRLSTALGALTVAEGIETQGQADIMQALGCDIGQGYWFARPGEPEAILDLLARTRRRLQAPPRLSAPQPQEHRRPRR